MPDTPPIDSADPVEVKGKPHTQAGLEILVVDRCPRCHKGPFAVAGEGRILCRCGVLLRVGKG